MDLINRATSMTPSSDNFKLEVLKSTYREQAKALITKNWGSSLIITKGKIHDSNKLDGFVFLKDNNIVGLITYNISNSECEIVTLDSLIERQGLGTKLVNKVIDYSQYKHCHRVWLITTNDNTHAMRFYQKLGFSLVGFYKDSVKGSRKIKSKIPMLGFDNIRIEHEIEFEYLLKN